MYIYKYNKLVRDKIPEKINSEEGRKANYRILDDAEYLIELNKKVLEEANEFTEENSIEELADLIEVTETIMNLKDITWDDIRTHQKLKNDKNGKFCKKIYLSTVEEINRNIEEEKELTKKFRKRNMDK